MNVLGLDLSLSASGFCVLDSVNAGVVDSGVIKAKDLSGLARLDVIGEAVFQKAKLYSPKLIAIEDYAFSAHAAHAHELGELGGVVKLSLHKAGFRLIPVAPTKLKKFVSGKGNIKKNQMLLAVYKKWGIEFTDDNECDAYGLARFALSVVP